MAVDTTGLDIVALYEQETGISLSKPVGRHRKACCKGPCFLCGGTDRFAAFFESDPEDDPPYFSHYHCGVHGTGCGWHGDAIDLVKEIHGFSFTEACLYLELPLDGTEYQGSLQAKPKAAAQDSAPGPEWQKQGNALCKDAVDFLWGETETAQRARNYLLKRGLSEETMKRARLGYLPEDRWFLRADWGLPEEEGKTKLFAPRGWYIPWIAYPHLWRIDIRRHPKDIEKAAAEKRHVGKYHKIAGSSEGLYNFQAIKENEPLIVVESPIDALIGQQETQEFHWIATGGTGGARNDPRWKEQISRAYPILLAFDSDEPGSRAYTDFWRDPALPIYRWLPTAHDINDMKLSGQSINDWALAGFEMAVTLDVERTGGDHAA